MTLGEYIESGEIFEGSRGDPPIPTVAALVGAPVDGARHISVRAPLDTCTGPTVISEELMDELDLPPCDTRPCVTYRNQTPTEYPVCALEVLLQGSIGLVLRAVVMPIGPRLIVGRDLLNRVRVTLFEPGNLVALSGGTGAGP